MMEATLHPAPRWRDVVIEQVRMVGLSLRIVALVVAVVLGIGTLMIGSEIVRGGSGFDSDDTFPIALVSFFFPFAVWRSEKRFGPSFLWTLPVERRRLALARVFAGGVWLTAAVAIFVTWLLTLALLGGVSLAHQVMRIPFTATIATYLLGSALVLGLRHPLRWMFGTAGVLFLMGSVSQRLEQFYGMQTLLGSSGLFFAARDAAQVWCTLPPLAQEAISFVFLGAGVAALWAAASRHRERRRH